LNDHNGSGVFRGEAMGAIIAPGSTFFGGEVNLIESF